MSRRKSRNINTNSPVRNNCHNAIQELLREQDGTLILSEILQDLNIDLERQSKSEYNLTSTEHYANRYRYGRHKPSSSSSRAYGFNKTTNRREQHIDRLRAQVNPGKPFFNVSNELNLIIKNDSSTNDAINSVLQQLVSASQTPVNTSLTMPALPTENDQILDRLLDNMNKWLYLFADPGNTSEIFNLVKRMNTVTISQQVDYALRALKLNKNQLEYELFKRQPGRNRRTPGSNFTNIRKTGNRLVCLYSEIGLPVILFSHVFNRKCLEMNSVQFQLVFNFIQQNKTALMDAFNRYGDTMKIIDDKYYISALFQ